MSVPGCLLSSGPPLIDSPGRVFLLPLLRELAKQPEEGPAGQLQHVPQATALVAGEPPAMKHGLGD